MRRSAELGPWRTRTSKQTGCYAIIVLLMLVASTTRSECGTGIGLATKGTGDYTAMKYRTTSLGPVTKRQNTLRCLYSVHHASPCGCSVRLLSYAVAQLCLGSVLHSNSVSMYAGRGRKHHRHLPRCSATGHCAVPEREACSWCGASKRWQASHRNPSGPGWGRVIRLGGLRPTLSK